MSWLTRIVDETGRTGAAVRVTVVRADGSTPRELGAAMVVSAGAAEGTIGGGALELAAVAHARALLGGETRLAHVPVQPLERAGDGPALPAWRREVRDYPLGPSLGQCCGGYVRLLFEVFGRDERAHLIALAHQCEGERGLVLRPLRGGIPPYIAADRKEHRPGWPLPVTRAVRDMLSGARPCEPLLVRVGKGEPAWLVEPLERRIHRLYLYGAGHVGRAIVRVLEDLPFAITWVDTSPARFPDRLPAHATAEVAPDPAALAGGVAAGAFHLVLTYSHALDLAICHSLLRRGDFRFLGLIGSATKRARFLKRLSELGIGQAELARLVCPIGLPGLRGKEPAVIALSVAAQLVQIAAADGRTLESAPMGKDAAR